MFNKNRPILFLTLVCLINQSIAIDASALVPPTIPDILMIAAIAIGLLVTVELAKLLRKLINKKKNYGY